MSDVAPSLAVSRVAVSHTFRRTADFVVVAFISLLFVHTWHVAWFVVPTGSTADALIGVHRDVTCGDCGFTFACDAAEPTPLGQRAVCPNCGYAEQSLESFPILGGDRLLVHKDAFALRQPRRWEMVAYRSPTQASQINVKRVVGLPGESIQIRDGDVYVNGQIARKTLAEQQAMAILVHDSRCEPAKSPGLPAHWRSVGGLRWTASAGRYTAHQTTGAFAYGETSPPDALTYHHVHRLPGDNGQTDEIAVDDRYGYNQLRPIRDLFATHDLLLTCRVRTQGDGRFVLYATDGQTEFLGSIDGAWRDVELFRDGSSVGKTELIPSRRDHDVVISLIDRQFALRIDGRDIFVQPFEPRGGEPSPRPFAIFPQGLGVELSNLGVWRDVYYTPPVGAVATAGVTTPYQLADGEYFVLGDNSPISEDSRYAATGPAVLANLLVGKPFMVYFPCRSAEFGGVRFQVPALSRIRYIP